MARTASGVDVGSATVRWIRGEVRGTSFVVRDAFIGPNPKGTLESGWEALRQAGSLGRVRVGISGRGVNLRYTRVPRLPDWQLRRLMRFETEEIGGQSDAPVSSDFNVLPEMPEIEGEDVVLLALARESLLDEHARGLSASGAKLDAFTPQAIALYNAFLHYGVVLEDTVLVADIGRENLDVVLVRGADLVFARNLSGGASLFDRAIAQRFGISEERAERYKREHGTLDTRGPFADPNQEKAARAMAAPAGQLLSLLQSAVLFAKSQIKLSGLKLDRVFLCGGGSRLEGLPEYLTQGLGVPVERFDPFQVVDTSKLAPETADWLEEHRYEAVGALGLATSASAPEAYGIEILPQRVRRRREFLQGPLWAIAAGLLAVLFLGARVWRVRQDLSGLEEQAGRLSRTYARAERNDARTRELLDENRELDRLARELYSIAGAGEMLVRALDAFERNLPRDFWFEGLLLEVGAEDELGVARDDPRPILRGRGRSREGTEAPAVLFEEFVQALRQGLPGVRMRERMGDSTFTLDLTTLAAPEAAEDPNTAAGAGR